MPNTKQNGFTLIELSIVLVIIGLIIGGVLVGRDLIDAGKIKAQISQLEEIKTAYTTFQLKYGCTAGDCANATDFFGSSTANGDGDGTIENNDSGCGTAGSCQYSACWLYNFEMPRVFEQLSLAGMITGQYRNSQIINIGYPSTRLNSGIGGMSITRDRLTYIDTCNSRACCGYARGLIRSYDCMGINEFRQTLFVILNYEGAPGYRQKSTLYGIFTPTQTLSMDSKIDDGKPFTGQLRAANPSDSGGAFVDGDCATDYTSRTSGYNVTNTKNACHIAFKLE
jgi:prepilin-type N-terminal cleavage/methylation domain-containing protein